MSDVGQVSMIVDCHGYGCKLPQTGSGNVINLDLFVVTRARNETNPLQKNQQLAREVQSI